ncbi:MAG TPA: nickel pincer cofactor biosynthesis protein LarC [Fredinandcohnia sp.]|nr:nickel pincer cofactor biosynthesis protein LarC [Fredinandcohnia sp.]
MTILWLDPVGGCSGDMCLAALFDLGVSPEAVRAELARLDLGAFHLRLSRAEKMGIHGTRVDVEAPDDRHERTWEEIRGRIEGAGLSAGATRRALAIFERLARAEAKVHGTTPERVHFHEVGAVDSIVDVVGVAVALDLLGIDEVRAGAAPLGGGMIETRHGPMPVPAAATLELLVGREVRSSGPGERTTPTGAAILAAVTEPGLPASFVPERIGYGIGHRDFDDAPNVLRACLGRLEHGGESLFVVEANLDDAAPQVLARAIDACLEGGALDAWVAPVTMKKGRPGHLLGALVPRGRLSALCEIVVRETPTLGVRYHAVGRLALERRIEEVETSFGRIPIKVGLLGSEVVGAAPEWEVCLAIARERKVPARIVREEALARWIARRS